MNVNIILKNSLIVSGLKSIPVNKERHFIVTKIEFDENSTINHCFIEAVITKQEKEINWIELKNEKIWLQGWK